MAAFIPPRNPLFPSAPFLIYNKFPEPIKQALERMKQVSTDLFDKMQNTVNTTDIPLAIRKIYEISDQVECAFNVLGCIPLLGKLSGAVRCLAGRAQITAGLVIVILSEISLFVIKNTFRNDSPPIQKKWKMIAQLGVEMTIQGCLNVLRGFSESLVAEYTFGLGNIAFIALNIKDGRNFNPHFTYGTFASLVEKQEEERVAAAAAQAEQKNEQGDGGAPHPFNNHEEQKKNEGV